MTFQGHTEDELARFLRLRLGSFPLRTPGCALDNSQVAAIQDFRKTYDTTTDFEPLIEFYFRTFDDLFFFGSLKARSEVHFVDNGSQEFRGVTYPPGSYMKDGKHVPWIGPGPPKCHLDIYKWEVQKNGVSIRDAYLNVLLHEMIHVYFSTYTKRTGKEACHQNLNSVGLGHGALWQEFAQILEIIGLRLLGIEFDLNRVPSLAGDLSMLERELTVSDVRPEWNIDQEQLLSSLVFMRRRWESKK